jgi:prolipoprotein diacylglyceryltransferase
MIIFSVVAFGFWLWMIIDLIQRNDEEFGEYVNTNSKLLWILLLLFTGFIGALVYYFLIYNKYPKK